MDSLSSRTDLAERDFIEIEAALNHWLWDDRLGVKPIGFDEWSIDERYEFISPYMEELGDIVKRHDSLMYSKYYATNSRECEEEQKPKMGLPEKIASVLSLVLSVIAIVVSIVKLTK